MNDDFGKIPDDESCRAMLEAFRTAQSREPVSNDQITKWARRMTLPLNDSECVALVQEILAAQQPSPTAVVLDDERAAFEAWGNETFNYGFQPDTWDAGEELPVAREACYQHEGTQMAWEGWQARATIPQPVAQPVEQTWAPVISRDFLGQIVREAWVKWAKQQPNPKPSWIAPYDELDEADKEADRQIGEAVLQWVMSIKSATWEVTPAQPVEQSRALTDDAERYRHIRALITKTQWTGAGYEYEFFLPNKYRFENIDFVIDEARRALTAARPASGEAE